MLVGFYWLFTLICAATYSGNLIATLTVPNLAPAVRDLDHLINGADTGWMTLAGTDLQQRIDVSRGREEVDGGGVMAGTDLQQRIDVSRGREGWRGCDGRDRPPAADRCR